MQRCTHNGRLKNRLKELAEARTDEMEYRGADHGSVSYRVPKKWIKINPVYTRNLSEEEREEMRRRMKDMKARQNTGD